MEFTAKVIADFLRGEIVGNPDVKVNNVAKIEEAQPGTLAFLSNPKYNNYLYTTQASIVLINNDFKIEKEVKPTLIKVPNAYEAFASLLQLTQQGKIQKTGIEERSMVSSSAKLGENVYVGSFAYIGENVKIEKNARIYPHNYVPLDDFKEIVSNLLPGIKIVRIKKDNEAYIFNHLTKSYFNFQPAIFLDGVPIDNSTNSTVA